MTVRQAGETAAAGRQVPEKAWSLSVASTRRALERALRDAP